MTKLCPVSRKTVLAGNNVSHANNKTRRRFLPNLQKVSFSSEILKKIVQLRVSTYGIRTIEHRGGLDNFLKMAPKRDLRSDLLQLKKQIEKKIASAEN